MISVAMALYNGAKYVEEQILSIENQTVKPDELVICNDCSTDNSLEIVESLRNKVSFNIIVINNEKNMKFTRTFSNAFEHTSGDYVFYVDFDDVWFPEKVESVVKEFEKDSRIQVITHNAAVVDSNLKPLGSTLFEHDVLNKKVYGTAIHGFATAVRRPILKYALPFHSSYTPDRWIALVGTELNVRKPLDKVLAYYRRHEGAMSFEYIGANREVFREFFRRVQRNCRNFMKTRTMEYFNWRRGKETAIIDFCNKIYAEKELPSWCDPELLKAFYDKALKNEECYRLRERSFELSGFARLDAILEGYKRGIYKPFHSYQTAIDDFFRGR